MRKAVVCLAVLALFGFGAMAFGDEWLNFDAPGWLSVRSAALAPDGSIWTWGGKSPAGRLVQSRLVDGEMVWRHYGRYNSVVTPGLITTIYADMQGLWIGTWDGLVLFSGLYSSIYTAENSPLPSNFVSAIVGDGEGGIWVGTGSGVCHFKEGVWSTFTSESTILPGQLVDLAMAYDAERQLLAITCGGADGLSLYAYQGQSWYSWSSESSPLIAASVTDMLFDNEGRLWIAYEEDGIQTFDGAIWTHYTSRNSGLAFDTVSDLALSPDKEVYAVCGGVVRFSDGRWVAVPITTVSAQTVFYRLLFDAGGDLWVFTSEGYIRVSGGMKTLYYPTNLGLVDAEEHHKIVCSRFTSAVWIAGLGGGLCRFQDGSWETWTLDNSPLESASIIDIAEAPDASIWVLSGEYSLDRYDGEGWTNFSRGVGYFSDCGARALLIDGDYNVWVGVDGGVLMFDGKLWTKLPLPEPNPVFSLAVDEDSGAVWAGAVGKVYRLAGEEWETHSLESGFVVCSLAVDAQGTLWGACWETTDPQTRPGAFSLEGTAVHYYRTDNSGILGNRARQVAVDSNDVKWFAIDLDSELPGGGISSFDGARWTNYTCANSGLVQKWGEWTPDFVSVACDDNGDKWFGSRYFGVSRLSKIGLPDPLPSIQLFTNKPAYKTGDLLRAAIVESNLSGKTWEVNLLVAIALPDGSLFYLPNLTPGPWVFMFQSIRPGTQTQPENFFEAVIPSWMPKGQYAWFAAFSNESGIIGKIASAWFTVD